MRITIISIGKIKEKYLQDAIIEYEKRLSKYVTISNIELKDEAIKSNIDDNSIKNIEGKRIIEYMNGYNIVLDLKGEEISSVEFAHKIESICNYSNSQINFIIGGSLGLSDEVIKQADYSLCMSKMTFPHQVAKVIILEQIYRAFKILNNEKYHK